MEAQVTHAGPAGPLVSVVIPAFNGERLIGRTIESALAQTYSNVEIIVVDDGSTDATQEVVRRFGDRVRYLRQPNQGGAAARNQGISAARGDWVAFLDQDDLWLPEKLERQAAVFLEEPSTVVCFTRWSHIDDQGKPMTHGSTAERDRLLDSVSRQAKPLGRGAVLLPEKPFTEALVKRCLVNSCSGVIARKSVLMEVGGFDAGLRGPDDWDLWMRLAVRYSFAYIPEALYQYRHHARQHTQHGGTQMLRDLLVVMERWLRSPEICRQAGRRTILSSMARLHDNCATARVNQGEMREARAHYIAALRARPKPATLALWSATFCPPIAARLVSWRTKRWDRSGSAEERDPGG